MLSPYADNASMLDSVLLHFQGLYSPARPSSPLREEVSSEVHLHNTMLQCHILTTLNYSTIHCPEMHCSLLQCTELHCSQCIGISVLYCTTMNFTGLHCTVAGVLWSSLTRYRGALPQPGVLTSTPPVPCTLYRTHLTAALCQEIIDSICMDTTSTNSTGSTNCQVSGGWSWIVYLVLVISYSQWWVDYLALSFFL